MIERVEKKARNKESEQRKEKEGVEGRTKNQNEKNNDQIEVRNEIVKGM